MNHKDSFKKSLVLENIPREKIKMSSRLSALKAVYNGGGNDKKKEIKVINDNFSPKVSKKKSKQPFTNDINNHVNHSKVLDNLTLQSFQKGGSVKPMKKGVNFENDIQPTKIVRIRVNKKSSVSLKEINSPDKLSEPRKQSNSTSKNFKNLTSSDFIVDKKTVRDNIFANRNLNTEIGKTVSHDFFSINTTEMLYLGKTKNSFKKGTTERSIERDIQKSNVRKTTLKTNSLRVQTRKSSEKQGIFTINPGNFINKSIGMNNSTTTNNNIFNINNMNSTKNDIKADIKREFKIAAFQTLQGIKGKSGTVIPITSSTISTSNVMKNTDTKDRKVYDFLKNFVLKITSKDNNIISTVRSYKINWFMTANYDIGSQLIFVKQVGAGSSAIVYLARDRSQNGVLRAVKIFEKKGANDSSKRKSIQHEIDMLTSLTLNKDFGNSNIVRLFRVLENKDRVYFVMNFGGETNLFQYLSKNALSKENINKIFLGIGESVSYLHRQNIYHRDLKLENFMIEEDSQDNFKICLIDFGLSSFLKYELEYGWAGTKGYSSPEVTKKTGYLPFPSDVWSLGVIFYKMVGGNYPFGTNQDPNLSDNILSAKYSSTNLNKYEKHILKSIFSLNPVKRPKIDDIISMIKNQITSNKISI